MLAQPFGSDFVAGNDPDADPDALKQTSWRLGDTPFPLNQLMLRRRAKLKLVLLRRRVKLKLFSDLVRTILL